MWSVMWLTALYSVWWLTLQPCYSAWLANILASSGSWQFCHQFRWLTLDQFRWLTFLSVSFVHSFVGNGSLGG